MFLNVCVPHDKQRLLCYSQGLSLFANTICGFNGNQIPSLGILGIPHQITVSFFCDSKNFNFVIKRTPKIDKNTLKEGEVNLTKTFIMRNIYIYILKTLKNIN